MWLHEALSVLRHIKDYPTGVLGDKIEIHEAEINTPLVLVHGFMSNKSIWKLIKNRFELLGWKNIYCFNYHVFRTNVRGIVTELDEFINKVTTATDNKIVMVGHSLGGIVIRDWATKYNNHKCIDKVITIGSPHLGTHIAHLGKILPCRTRKLAKLLLPNSAYLKVLNGRRNIGDIKWGAIYSASDELIFPRVNALYPEHYNAEVFKVDKVGHIRMAYAIETTLICHKFLTRKEAENGSSSVFRGGRKTI